MKRKLGESFPEESYNPEELIGSSDKAKIEAVIKELIKDKNLSGKELDKILKAISKKEKRRKKNEKRKETARVQSLDEKVQEILSIIKEIKEIIYNDGILYEQYCEIAEKLKKIYKNECIHYLTYHIFAGSTAKKSEILYFDFPDEDSLIVQLFKLVESSKKQANQK